MFVGAALFALDRTSVLRAIAASSVAGCATALIAAIEDDLVPETAHGFTPEGLAIVLSPLLLSAAVVVLAGR